MFKGVGVRGGEGFPTASCRLDVGVCYTRGAGGGEGGDVGGGGWGGMNWSYCTAWMARKITR